MTAAARVTVTYERCGHPKAESLHRACKQLAATENVTISTVVREALTAHVTRRAQSDEQQA